MVAAGRVSTDILSVAGKLASAATVVPGGGEFEVLGRALAEEHDLHPGMVVGRPDVTLTGPDVGHLPMLEVVLVEFHPLDLDLHRELYRRRYGGSAFGGEHLSQLAHLIVSHAVLDLIVGDVGQQCQQRDDAPQPLGVEGRDGKSLVVGRGDRGFS